jgi:CheY-like chemotaxis protein
LRHEGKSPFVISLHGWIRVPRAALPINVSASWSGASKLGPCRPPAHLFSSSNTRWLSVTQGLTNWAICPLVALALWLVRLDRMATTNLSGRRILVVDDDPLVCDSIRRMLAIDGHQVEMATSGEQALALFEVGKFDLILADYVMPGMNGDKLAAAIKALAPNQRIGFFTGYEQALQSSELRLPGAESVLSKPFSLEELRQATTKLLTKP